MAQAIAETVFDCLYLSFALIAGLTMLIKGKGPLVKKAGLMSALLGAGDAFHLIPRSYALWTTGLEATIVCPLDSMNFRNVDRISDAVNIYIFSK